MKSSAKSLSKSAGLKLAGVIFAVAASVVCTAYFMSNIADDGPSSNYFPRQISASTEHWYSKHLSAMGEQKLYKMNESNGQFIFRFTWLRTFHHPICLRLVHSRDGKTVLYGKELDGAGGYEPGSLITDQKIELTSEQYREFKHKLDSSFFYLLSTKDRNNEGKDGAQWIFEINDSGHYHVVDRWCPDGSLRELGLWLLDAAKMTPSDHVY